MPMIILNKKRILFIMLAVVVAVCIPGISRDGNSIEVTALPVSNKVIVLDAGHGFPDERGGKC